MMLQLTEDLLQQIRQHGEDHYPREGAGVILGRPCDEARRAVALIPLANRSPEPSRRYHLTPQDMLAAELEAQRLELDILGVFHSHPDTLAEPSRQDLGMAFPWFSYVITSIHAGEARRTRSWRLPEGDEKWSEERITILRSGADEGCE
jgi:proteasome lid subunit RPN8/RPN11